ncbi:MAG: T9SS type A sorting domain-containing protein [Flavobacteriales bacterium]
MKKIFLYVFCLFASASMHAQLPDSCKLEFGINISGLCDWCTEMPFVDLMKSARTWGTQNLTWVDGGQNPWDSQVISSVPKDENGYPLAVPFFEEGLGLETEQQVYTVWASTTEWQAGEWTFLYEGTGEFDFWGDATVVDTAPGIIHFNVTPGQANIIKLSILSSDPTDHVRNFRVLMPGSEDTYQNNPFNQPWLDLLEPFSTIRFMDWGRTNSWGHEYAWECYDEDSDTIPTEWQERAQENYYTWTTNKGVPYESMVDLCNLLDKDAWVCVPYIASDGYIENLATFFRDNLEPERHVYVEYSNENWNWMFGQSQFLYTFGCVNQGQTWPEGIVPYIQNCLDIWSSVFADDLERITRTVGVQGGWQDVSNRIVFNMTPGSFDAFSPAAYFGFSEDAELALDQLGANATAADVAYYARESREEHFSWLQIQKETIADSLNIPMVFYEGGQHLTPNPFGEEPLYAQALLDVQRDTAIYYLYSEWFNLIRTLTEDEPTQFMHFSFIGPRSARYGSWGLLEGLYQDTSDIPAPKYQAVLDNVFAGCFSEINSTDDVWFDDDILVYPNPAFQNIQVLVPQDFGPIGQVTLYNQYGQIVEVPITSLTNGISLAIQHISNGVYTIQFWNRHEQKRVSFIKW